MDRTTAIVEPANRAELELFESLFSGTPEALSSARGELVVFRRVGDPPRYDFISPNVERLTGVPARDFTPAVWSGLVEERVMRGDAAGLTVDEARHRHRSGRMPRWHAECRIRHRDGSVRWVLEVGIALTDEQGRYAGAIGFLQDITLTRQFGITPAAPPAETAVTIEPAPMVVWTTDAELRFLTSEGSGLGALGLRPGEVVGRSLEQFFGVSPEGTRSIRHHRSVLEGRPQTYATVWAGRDYSVHLEPLRGGDGHVSGVLGIATDMTALRAAETRLMASEAYERALLQTIPDLIAVLREDGTYADFKAELGGTGRVPAVEVVGRNLREFPFAREDLDVILRAIADALETGRTQRLEYRFTEGGHETWWDARITRLDAHHVVGVSRDITDRKRVEAEHRRLSEQMRSAQQLESLGVLAGGIAHDFNNLLVGILGNADSALRDLAADHPAAECMRDVREAALRAAELTNLMLAYAGRGRFQIAAADLNQLVREVLHLAQAAISKKIALRVELRPGLRPVLADVAQIRQVVMNLIVNAAEAIGEVEGSIRIRTDVVEVDELTAGSAMPAGELTAGRYLLLEVSDDGCGMDTATRTRIFEPFFTTKFTGRGLGLAAVLGILRGHKGGIEVASAPGTGSTFRIYLPPGPETAVTAPPEPPAPAAVSTAVARVLVVDDEPVVRRVTQRILERHGFTVQLACDGREAVRLLKATPDSADLVLMDLTMPGMGGEEAVIYLRNMGFTRPILLMSGYDETEAAGLGEAMGVRGFLRKPFHAAQLVGAVRAALAK